MAHLGFDWGGVPTADAHEISAEEAGGDVVATMVQFLAQHGDATYFRDSAPRRDADGSR